MEDELRAFFCLDKFNDCNIDSQVGKKLINKVVEVIKLMIETLTKHHKLSLNFSSLIIVYDYNQLVNSDSSNNINVQVKLIDFSYYKITEDNIISDANSITPLTNLLKLITSFSE